MWMHDLQQKTQTYEQKTQASLYINVFFPPTFLI